MSSDDYYDNIKKTFPDILKKHFGIVTTACKEAGISRETFYRWRRESDEFYKQCDEAYEEAGDFVENQLLTLIAEKDTSAVIFYCKTKLRNRGYSEKFEHEHYGNRDKDSILQDVTHTMDAADQAILDRYYQKRLNSEKPID